MKKTIGKKLLSYIVVALTALTVLMSFGVLACEPGENIDPPVPPPVQKTEGPETGVYYYGVDSDNEYLIGLSSGDKFSFMLGDANKSGTYAVSGTEITLDFAKTEDGSVKGELKDDVIAVTYENKAMRFLKRKYFKATFESSGGSAVGEVSVMNGKTLKKPSDPTRAGYSFIGWYKDEQFKTPFVFGTEPMTANVKLYARWAQLRPGEAEYTVTLDYNDGATAAAKLVTVGGKIFDLPTPAREGYTFAGWWISMHESADKLSYKYDAQMAFEENTTLFALWTQNAAAPLVSVSASSITWDAVAGATNYAVKIEKVNGESSELVDEKTASTTTESYDFASKDAGDYKITVTPSGSTASTVRWYRNKALRRVSLFSVSEPSALVFAGVSGAEKYYIDIDCGNAEHNHKPFDNGNSTNYNFTNCAMKAGGIVFKVTATAVGRASSVSAEFKYDRTLAEVSGYYVDEATQIIKWDSVQGATEYKVTVECGNAEYNHAAYTNSASYGLKECAPKDGGIKVKVSAVAKGYNASAESTYIYNKTRLATPSNVVVGEKKLTWSAVANATGYEVSISGKTAPAVLAPTTECSLEDSRLFGIPAWDDNVDYTVTVKALAADNANNSLPSDAIPTRYASLTAPVSYANGVVSWKAVIGAASYEVLVNGRQAALVSDGKNYAEINLTKAGENTIEIRYFDGTDYYPTPMVSVKVFAHTVTFDTDGGTAVANKYKAVGDPLNLPTNVTKEGYEFGGWYNAPGGAKSNAAKYDNDEKFTSGGDIVIYAYWKPTTVSVSLNSGSGTPIEASVVYGESCSLPVPENADASLAFGGWYSGYNGTGTQYTDTEGKGKFAWNRAQTSTLYAKWYQAFKFKQLVDGTYSVTKGADISGLTSVTVPKLYEGKPVTVIEGYAFSSCPTLESVTFYDYVREVVTSSAFSYDTALTAVNVIHVADRTPVDNEDPVYESKDGVLIKTENLVKSLAYYPQGRTGSYEIPNGVTEIPSKLFSGSKLSMVIIPASVTLIRESAFYNNKELKRVTFKKNRAGELLQGLSVGTKVFQNCTALREINAPARLESFAADALSGCTSLTAINVFADGTQNPLYSSINGVLTTADKSTLIYCPLGISGSYTIPREISAIGTSAFQNHAKITDVIVPATVTEIGAYGFASMTALKSVTFKGTAFDPLSIGDSAFYYCRRLSSVVFEDGSNVASLGASAFASCSALTSFTIPVTMKTIKDKAFSACTLLTKIRLPAGITELMPNVFNGCTSLQGVYVDENNPNFTDIEGVLFDKNKTKILYYSQSRSDETYTLPDTVTEIGGGAFQGNRFLLEMTIPGKVTKIGDNAFDGCAVLETVTFTAGTEPLTFGSYVFANIRTLKNIVVPARTQAISDFMFYRSAGESLVIEDGPTSIGESAFGAPSSSYSVKFDTLVLPNSVKTIDNEAFRYYAYNSPVTKMTLPSALESMGNSVFYMAKIENVALPDSLKTVGKQLFSYSSVTSVSFGDNPRLERFSPGMFYYSQIGKINIPASITSVDGAAFYNCSSLMEVIFDEPKAGEEEKDLIFGNETASNNSNGVYNQYDGVFYKCTSLRAITFPARIVSLGMYAFKECTVLDTVTFKADSRLTKISGNVFESLSTLTKVEFLSKPEKLETIGVKAFYGCKALGFVGYKDAADKIVLSSGDATTGLKTIGAQAFYDTTALSSKITIPKTVTSLGYNAFGKSGVIEVEFEEGDEAVYGTLSVDYGTASHSYLYGLFYNAPGLKSVKISSRVTDIGEYPFYNDNTTAATAAKNVLSKITVAEGNKNYSAKDNILYNADKTKLYYSAAAAGDSTGYKVTIPSTVTYIENAAFYNSKFLTKVEFEAGGENLIIGDDSGTEQGAFAYCVKLADITLPARTYKIGSRTFYACQVLPETFIIPKNVVYVGHNAFYGSTSTLRTINFEAGGTQPLELPEAPSASSVYGAFNGAATITTIKLPADRSVAIGSYTFYGCKELTGLSLGSNVTIDASLGRLFYNCAKLTSVDLPAVADIGPSSFFGCAALSSVRIPSNMQNIVFTDFFSGCTSLTHVDVASGNTAYSKNEWTSGSGSSAKLNSVLLDASGKVLLYVPTGLSGEYTVPDGITTIADKAFMACTYLTKVTIPSGVFSIGTSAFEGCIALKKVVIGSGVTEIRTRAFYGCSVLTDVNIPGGVTRLEPLTFYNCKALKNVVFDPGTEPLSIVGGDDIASPTYSTSAVFGNCNALISAGFVLPDRLVRIGKFALSYIQSTSLTSLTIPKGVRSVGRQAFYNCTKLQTVTFEEGGTAPLEFEAATSYSYGIFNSCSALVTVKLPERLTEISDYTFYGVSKLSAIEIPKNVTRIGNGAFSGCTALAKLTFAANGTESLEIANGSSSSYGAFKGVKVASVVFPKRLTSIGSYAFYQVTALTSVGFEEDPAIENIGTSAFSACTALNTVTVPNTIATIGAAAFYNCGKLNNLTFEAGGTVPLSIGLLALSSAETNGAFAKNVLLASVVLPERTETIGDYAFGGCTKLVLSVPSKVKSIGIGSFKGCTSLTEVTIPESVKTIGANAFTGCTKMSELELLIGVEKIGNYAFSDCTELEAVNIPGSVATLGEGVFSGCTKLVNITSDYNCAAVFEDSGILYNADKNQIIFFPAFVTGAVTIPSGIASISPGAFKGAQFTEITIPDTITVIPENAFTEAKSLKKVNLPAGITSIGANAFKDCVSLEEIELGDLITSIGNEAFLGCVKLKGVNLGKSLTSVGTGAFKGCTALEDIALFGAKGFILGTSAFEGCSSLVGIDTTGSKLTTIDTTAFKGCVGLTSAKLVGNLTTVNSKAFLGCTSLADVEIGDKVTTIGSYAFAFLASLKKLSFAGGTSATTTISTFAFTETGITSFEIPANVGQIGDYAFSGCASLGTVTYETGGKIGILFGANAFANNENLTSVSLPNRMRSNYAYVSSGYSTTTLHAIGKSCFANCKKLGSVTFEAQASSPLAGAMTLGENAFENCVAIQSISLPEYFGNYTYTYSGYGGGTSVANANAIDRNVFLGCTSLNNVSFSAASNAMTYTIGGYAFKGCPSLVNLTFTDKLVGVRTNAFTDSSVKNLVIPASVRYADSSNPGLYSEAFSGSKLEVVRFADDSALNTLPDKAFKNCEFLREVYLPSTLTTIGAEAFSGCVALTTLSIPDRVTSLVSNPFIGIADISSFTFNSAFMKKDGALYETVPSGKKLVALSSAAIGADGSYTMDSDVVEIGKDAARAIHALKSLTIPKTVATVNEYAFADNPNLTTVTFDSRMIAQDETFNGAVTVGENKYRPLTLKGYMFNSSSVVELILPEGLRIIDSNVFANMCKLNKVSLPSSLGSIASYGFSNCYGLVEVENHSTLAINKGDGISVNGGVGLYAVNIYTNADMSGYEFITQDGLKFYKNATECTLVGYIGSATQLTLPDKIGGLSYKIAPYAFYCNSVITEVILPNGLTEIGTYAFAYCENLENVVIPSSVKKIGDWTFSYCYALKKATFSGNDFDIEIGARAFQMSGLTSIVLPDGLEKLDSLFYGCASLEQVTLPSTITSIASLTFSGNKKLRRIVIPEKVGEIGSNAFEYCYALDEVINLSALSIAKGMDSNGKVAYYASRVVFSEEGKGTFTTTAEGYEFYYGGGEYYLVGYKGTSPNLVLPADFNGNKYKIAAYAFYQRKDISSITISEGVEEIGMYAFYQCTELRKFVGGTDLKVIGAYSFGYCTTLYSATYPSDAEISTNSFYSCSAL